MLKLNFKTYNILPSVHYWRLDKAQREVIYKAPEWYHVKIQEFKIIILEPRSHTMSNYVTKIINFPMTYDAEHCDLHLLKHMHKYN